jgi:hypothetical protein
MNKLIETRLRRLIRHMIQEQQETEETEETGMEPDALPVEKYSVKFILWFIGTVLNTVKHPIYGKHQLRADQWEKSPESYKKRILKAIDTAFKQGYLDSDRLKQHG